MTLEEFQREIALAEQTNDVRRLRLCIKERVDEMSSLEVIAVAKWIYDRGVEMEQQKHQLKGNRLGQDQSQSTDEETQPGEGHPED